VSECRVNCYGDKSVISDEVDEDDEQTCRCEKFHIAVPDSQKVAKQKGGDVGFTHRA